MDGHELFQAGKLQEAIDFQIAQVKANPADQGKRLFLFELFAFAGELDRARKQIDALNYDELELQAAVSEYRRLLESEEARRRVFHEGAQPKFLTDSHAEHVRLRLEALGHLRENRRAEAAESLAQAAEAAPLVKGQLNDRPFDGLRDCDDLFGGVIEVFAQGSYFWVPLEDIELIAINPPRFPRDLLWAGARLETHVGEAGQIFLPALYPDSHTHADEQVKLGRMTDWLGDDDGPVFGRGLRMFLAGEDASTLLEWRQLQIDAPPSDGGETEPPQS
ncbi:MAG TPA: type VI secretion system accessory protein TagJ [Pirellulales bacterium]|jgi:type VI secretion system protein ImpE|nr:type VI secretion system accessory protein TagJ [Pirellulales bacterium]